MSALDKALGSFFGNILKGESKTYNDHNWYANGVLKGYIEGKNASPYPLLKKPLSEYTIGEVMRFQSNPRDNNGQLFATGRYQIIPSTLKGLVKKANLSENAKYDKATQDQLGLELLKERSGIKSYIYGSIPDTTENLNNAVTQVAMVWSSVGVPQDMKGKYGMVKRGQSYYAGGGDTASVNPEIVASSLKKLRSAITKVSENKGLIIATGIAILGIAGWVLYRTLKNKPIIPKT
jgi:hypothetical protein